MNIFQSLISISKKDKKQLVWLIIWLIAGIAMLIMGISAIINSAKAIQTISTLLGIFALATGGFTVAIRISEAKVLGISKFSIDGLIWLVLAILLFNTSLLSKLGKVAFIVIGIVMILTGAKNLFFAVADRNESKGIVPRLIIPSIIVLLGLFVVLNAESVFNNLLALTIGIYLIVHSISILYGWIGRVKYFINFRGTEND